MQYKIPQNVRVEDKIVGPLTLKQLISLGIGGGITYAIYIKMANDYIFIAWFIPVAITGSLTAAFTFLKIQGLSFAKWMLLMIEYLKNPKRRYFIMGSADFHTDIFKTHKQSKNNKKSKMEKSELNKAQKDGRKLKNIAEISKTLDNYGKSTAL